MRVNAADTPWFTADLKALVRSPACRGIVLPKASQDAVNELDSRLASSISVMVLVETARGMREVDDLVCHPRVEYAAFGSIDHALDVGCAHTDQALLLARSAIVAASAAGEVAAPVAGVTDTLTDAGRLEHDARLAGSTRWTTRPRPTWAQTATPYVTACRNRPDPAVGGCGRVAERDSGHR